MLDEKLKKPKREFEKMEEIPDFPEKQKPGARGAIRVSVKVLGWISLEWAFGQLGRIADH